MLRPVTEEEILRIYRETIDPLYAGVSRRCGGDRELTEDVVQETWLRAVREWRRGGVPTAPIAWLTTVARNLLLNEFRKRAPMRLDDLPLAAVLAATENGAESESADAARMVLTAMARLPERQAWLLETFHFDRWRISRIAASMGISERAVEGRLRRARLELRRELERLLNPKEQLL